MSAAGDLESEARLEGAGTTAFGKYKLFASLGRGGMADVFLSVAPGAMGVSKLAVIKRLRPALAHEISFRKMFVDEARLAALLSHPNIVHTYEVGEQNGVYFIAMEFLEGQPLNKVLKETVRRREIIEPEVAVRVVADALGGLGYAHDLRDYDGRPLGVIHRDVSPHNLFVTYDGHTKLVDFGIAKAAFSSAETEAGVLKGKVAYMSPEQATGQHIDARSDLFAMGIVLWELIAQERLMTGASAANTLHKLMNEPIPRLSRRLVHVDPELDALVARSLEKDPDRRWQSAREMRAALETWLARQPEHSRHEDVGRRMMTLFGSFREETQRQIQKYMGVVAAAESTQELRAPTAESLRWMAQSGANASGRLLTLGPRGNGCGRGIVANDGALPSRSSAFPSLALPHSSGAPPPPEEQESSSALLIAITIGCFLLAGLLIVAVGLRDRRQTAALRDAPAEEPGFVTVSAYPWAKVTEGATVVCPITPCNRLQMSAGSHTLTFENGGSSGQKQTVTVEVKSGETATKDVGFE
jgi:serine/threonine-protein kinase